jgi:hypothetical protein
MRLLRASRPDPPGEGKAAPGDFALQPITQILLFIFCPSHIHHGLIPDAARGAFGR